MSGNLASRGFTLVEMVVAMSVLVVLVTVAVPGFQRFTADQRLKSTAQSLYATLLYARTEALKRNTPVYVHPNGGDDDDWKDGWFVTTNSARNVIDCDNASADADVLQTYCGVRRTGVEFAGGAPGQVAYRGSGRADAASFLLCDSRAGRPRTVSVQLGGLPLLRQQGSCP